MSKSIQIKAGRTRQETALTVALGIHINTSIKHYSSKAKHTKHIPIEFGPTGNSGNCAIRSADPENPSLEPNLEWIGCTVCEIFAFKLFVTLNL